MMYTYVTTLLTLVKGPIRETDIENLLLGWEEIEDGSTYPLSIGLRWVELHRCSHLLLGEDIGQVIVDPATVLVG